jgi:ABC-type multidrug transport system permease subunit
MEEPKVKQTAGVISLAVAMAIAAVLLAGFVLSIFLKTFAPWWFWLGGLLTTGAFGISAGILLQQDEDEEEEASADES